VFVEPLNPERISRRRRFRGDERDEKGCLRMGVPKRRHSPTRRDKRRAHDGLTAPNIATCPQCHEPVLPHHVCPHCGFYKGKEVVTVEEEK
jgi:large subunit ribosomal protein L32